SAVYANSGGLECGRDLDAEREPETLAGLARDLGYQRRPRAEAHAQALARRRLGLQILDRAAQHVAGAPRRSLARQGDLARVDAGEHLALGLLAGGHDLAAFRQEMHQSVSAGRTDARAQQVDAEEAR